MQNVKLDEKDVKILELLQKNCKLPIKDIAFNLNIPITTVYAKIKRMEELKLIKGYKTILDYGKIGKGTLAFILVSVAYRPLSEETLISQREIAKEISKFPEVQEVHIISGDWDILIKVRAENVDAIGRFVIDKLRTVKGIQKTLTCMVFDSIKEDPSLTLK
ncbi:Lrp/AsnC family transcriptional regulator [Candidatus Bathyarchaeota archaeon]|nr:Lrp/AsnC family transcriptional regulator [Candidatus Bathyarchaeota archaeon]